MIEYYIKEHREKIVLTEDQDKDMDFTLIGNINLENLFKSDMYIPQEIKNIPETNQIELNETGSTTYSFSTLTTVVIQKST